MIEVVMTVINREKIKDLYFADLLYSMHIAMEKIKNFENKYNKSFSEFETHVKSSEENFSEWDDYLEWKAIEKSFIALQREKEDIINGNYKISL